MKVEEATLFLEPNEGEELSDTYERKLFEFKSFFAGRFPVAKLVNSKLKSLDKLNNAFVTLGGTLHSMDSDPIGLSSDGTIRHTFNNFQEKSNQIKQLIYGATDGFILKSLVHNYVDLTRQYARFWQQEFDSFDGVIVSKEPDVMEILKAIGQFESSGYSRIVELEHLEEGNVLLSERKRLSLWLKMDADG